MSNKKRGFLIGFVVIILLFIALGIYYMVKKPRVSDTKPKVTPDVTDHEENSSQTGTLKDLALDDDTVKTLHQYFQLDEIVANIFNNLVINGKFSANDISPVNRNQLAYRLLDQKEYQTVKNCKELTEVDVTPDYRCDETATNIAVIPEPILKKQVETMFGVAKYVALGFPATISPDLYYAYDTKKKVYVPYHFIAKTKISAGTYESKLIKAQQKKYEIYLTEEWHMDNPKKDMTIKHTFKKSTTGGYIYVSSEKID